MTQQITRYRGGEKGNISLLLSLRTFKKIILGLIISVALLTPHLGYASVIEVGPTEPTIAEGNAIVRNFTMEFSNKTNATLENYVTTSDKGNAIIQAVNTILMGQDYEPLADEEELEEEQEEEESSSSSSSTTVEEDEGPGLGGGPGDDIVFPDDTEEPQPFPGDGSNNGSDGETEEEESSESDTETAE